ncbi:EF-hand domain-containing protein [Sphingomonas sp. RS6]
MAALLLGIGGFLLVRGSASPAIAPVAAAPAVEDSAGAATAFPDEAPAATARTREQKRFDRYDKNRDDAIGREEYLASRRKAFARLDTNNDGRLDFEEWAARTIDKFASADADKSGTLTRAEFLVTAPKRRTPPRCACAPAPKPNATTARDEAEDETP